MEKYTAYTILLLKKALVRSGRDTENDILICAKISACQESSSRSVPLEGCLEGCLDNTRLAPLIGAQTPNISPNQGPRRLKHPRKMEVGS